MYGISSVGKEEIGRVVEDLFDKMALQLIGEIPRLKHKKWLAISYKPNMGLANLFVQSMENKSPNPIEQDALKSMLDTAFNYIESLKQKTRASLLDSVDGLIKEAQSAKMKVAEEDIQRIILAELNKAKAHLKLTIESESTKLRNVGRLMDISRVSSSIGDTDPSVFFVVIKDKSTCKECMRLHLMPDQVTPRVWKFSELKQSYHKRSENFPSAFGLHPHCRCTLTYLSPGFGFKGGAVSYISKNYNEFNAQRGLSV